VTDHHRPHILIVSDDLDLGQFLQDGLTIAGFWTSTVASALQTLELFRLRTFDLALIDAALEGLGAEELVRRLRTSGSATSEQRTDIPILLIAGNREEVSDDGAREMGADSVRYPPIEIEEFALELFAQIRDWRKAHPERDWADEIAQRRPNTSTP
jgi:DNA-binding response OmpR family regulator